MIPRNFRSIPGSKQPDATDTHGFLPHRSLPAFDRGLALAKPPAAVGNASASDMFRIVAPASTSAVAAPAAAAGGGAGGWASASSPSPMWFTTDPTRGEVGVNRRLPAVLYQVMRSEGGGGGSAERHEDVSDPLLRSAPMRQALARQSSGGAAQMFAGGRQNVLLRGSSHPHGRLKAVANRQVVNHRPKYISPSLGIQFPDAMPRKLPAPASQTGQI